MKKCYIEPEVEFVMFDEKEGFIVTCSQDCASCYFLECEPSDCYVASPSASSFVEPGVPATGRDFTEIC